MRTNAYLAASEKASTMSSVAKLPLTNKELAEQGGGLPLRYPATEEEYWDLAQAAEFRADYFKQEIIAQMSYESSTHSDIVNDLMFLLKTLFGEQYRYGHSNRPICVPACGNAIFNPDGTVIQLPDSFYEYRPGMTAELTPYVLFEVLSSSTRLRDWGEKLPCYKEIASLKYILYLESETARLHLLERLPDSQQWLESRFDSLDDTFLLDGHRLRLADIYACFKQP
jgi:Uma2 family endonuclease